MEEIFDILIKNENRLPEEYRNSAYMDFVKRKEPYNPSFRYVLAQKYLNDEEYNNGIRGVVLDPRAGLLRPRRAHVDGDAVAAGVLDAPQVQDLAAVGGKVEHLVATAPRTASWSAVRGAARDVVRAMGGAADTPVIDRAERVAIEEVCARVPHDRRLASQLLGISLPTFRLRAAAVGAAGRRAS
jgi:hypothetical protein